MKLIDPTLKLTTFQNETIDTSDQLSSSAAGYTFQFKERYKLSKSPRVYIFHKIEPTIPLAVSKYRNR